MKPIKVTPGVIIQFKNDFLNGKFPHQRLGQAFVNKYLEGTHTELFYEEDAAKAEKIIWEKYSID